MTQYEVYARHAEYFWEHEADKLPIVNDWVVVSYISRQTGDKIAVIAEELARGK